MRIEHFFEHFSCLVRECPRDVGWYGHTNAGADQHRSQVCGVKVRRPTRDGNTKPKGLVLFFADADTYRDLWWENSRM